MISSASGDDDINSRKKLSFKLEVVAKVTKLGASLHPS
jgi:hypothetical protein